MTCILDQQAFSTQHEPAPLREDEYPRTQTTYTTITGIQKIRTETGAKQNPKPINRIIRGKSKSTGLSAPVQAKLPRGDSQPGLPLFSSNSISPMVMPSLSLAAAFPRARMTSTICAKESEMEARSEETTHKVRIGRAP